MKTSNKNQLFNKVTKLPLGIISGASGIVAFFSIIGIIVAYVISSGIAAQTNNTVTIFETWWQTLLFVIALISVVIAIAALVLYCLKAFR